VVVIRISPRLCQSLLLVALLGHSAGGEEQPYVFPAATWEEIAPETLELDDQKLTELSEFAGGNGCVVRHGYLAFTWGDAAQRTDIASCCKPWYAHFLFKAIEDGRLRGLDERVMVVEPRLGELNAALDHKDGEIRWRHLVTQTSCYGVKESPGRAFDYSDYNMALLYDNLFLKLYCSESEQVNVQILHQQLTDVLQCQDEPRFNLKGRLAVSPRDFARFGLLYLRGGNWNGQQVISREHVRTLLATPLPADLPRTSGAPAEMIAGQRSIGGGSNQTDHFGSYSFTWWTNGVDRQGKRHWPNVPHDAVGAFGHAGKRAMVLLPSKDLIVVWNETRVHGPQMEDRALELLVSAIRE
jgi:hypothetical protein